MVGSCLDTARVATRGVPEIKGRGPITRITVFWGLYWGPPILGNYHVTRALLAPIPLGNGLLHSNPLEAQPNRM